MNGSWKWFLIAVYHSLWSLLICNTGWHVVLSVHVVWSSPRMFSWATELIPSFLSGYNLIRALLHCQYLDDIYGNAQTGIGELLTPRLNCWVTKVDNLGTEISGIFVLCICIVRKPFDSSKINIISFVHLKWHNLWLATRHNLTEIWLTWHKT